MPIATKVVCFPRLLKCLRSLYDKQCGPRSDCSYRSSLFWVHAVCFCTKFVSNLRQLFAAEDFSRRHFQMPFFLGALRVNTVLGRKTRVRLWCCERVDDSAHSCSLHRVSTARRHKEMSMSNKTKMKQLKTFKLSCYGNNASENECHLLFSPAVYKRLHQGLIPAYRQIVWTLRSSVICVHTVCYRRF